MTLHEDWHKAHPNSPCEYDTCPRGQALDLENATYTAAEVKVLTETASKVAYALGRKDAGEEIAKACMERAEESNYGLEESAFVDAAHLCQEIASRPTPDASEPRTDLGMDSDLPPEPQAVRSPQEDA